MIKKWPLHPKPYDYELLYNWTERLAKAYGVSHINFCRNVLKLERDEISSLRSSIPENVVTILANGTGVSESDLSQRHLWGMFEQLVQGIIKEIEKEPHAFDSWLQKWGQWSQYYS